MYNLEVQTQQRFYNEAQEHLMQSFKEEYLYDKFKVGNGVKDKNRLEHSMIMSETLCTSNCEIINFIQDKIEGLLEGCHTPRKRFNETISIFEKNYNHKPKRIPYTIDSKMFWTEAVW